MIQSYYRVLMLFTSAVSKKVAATQHVFLSPPPKYNIGCINIMLTWEKAYNLCILTRSQKAVMKLEDRTYCSNLATLSTSSSVLPKENKILSE